MAGARRGTSDAVRKRAGTMRSQRGAAAAEFALILPLFLLMVVGAIDFGRAFWAKNTLANVAREATRYASVRSVKSKDPATPEKVAGKVFGVTGPLDPETVHVQTTWEPSNSPGATVRVDVSYTFEPILPLLFIESIELTGSSQKIISY
jgi:Flp pilus assembly protein TadG